MQNPEHMQREGSGTEGSRDALDKAAEGVTQIKRRADETTQEAKGAVRGQIDQRSTEYGQKLKAQVGDLRKLTGQLRAQGQTVPAQVVERAVEPAERLANYLESSDADRILRDVENFARRQPWAVAGAAFVVGLAGARFLKAASGDRSRTAMVPTGRRTVEEF